MLDYLEHLKLRGQLGAYLEEPCSRLECEVRVDEVLRDPFEVTTGLRQGCVYTFTHGGLGGASIMYRL